MNKNKAIGLHLFLIVFISLFFFSCESGAERQIRVKREREERLEIELNKQLELEKLAFEKEQDSIEDALYFKKQEEERKIELEILRKKKATYDQYINNSLFTGAMPYDYCFGNTNSCTDYSCSQIKVKTPYNSDVLVTIKNNNRVVRHAYINSGSSYTFDFPDGIYQAFFYYGKGWYPDKVMTKTTCGTLKGGFIEDEHFGKDNPQSLSSNILSYELILQENGNFSTKPSNSVEAF